MSDQNVKNIRLGLFVISGIAFTVVLLYMIGSSRNLFSSSFEISATFNNVNGLLPGNNVRLSGIDVGTVKRIAVTSDSSVQVFMIINKKMRKYIRRNSIASVGTDGLMGSKLVNINSLPGKSEQVNSGDTLKSLRPIESDEMLRTLNTTNLNLAQITTDMKMITHKLNSSTSIWSLIQDPMIGNQLKSTIDHIKSTAAGADKASTQINKLLSEAITGRGTLGTLISDTLMVKEIRLIMNDVKLSGQKVRNATEDLQKISDKLRRGEGTIDLIMTDSALRNDIKITIRHLRSASVKIDEDLEAVRESFLLRKYFKKSEKEKKE